MLSPFSSRRCVVASSFFPEAGMTRGCSLLGSPSPMMASKYISTSYSTSKASMSQPLYSIYSWTEGSTLRDQRSPPGATIALAWKLDNGDIDETNLGVNFEQGVELFNSGEYYKCHDILESLWNNAQEPQRGIYHGILQCSVGLYHLFHQNHKGAMVEFGEGLMKLRRAGFREGPFHDFEREASAVLEFIYNTQLEHAACSDDMCIAMDGSEKSYQLLGNFGSGQILYKLVDMPDGRHIEFLPERPANLEFTARTPVIVKVPILLASEEDLYNFT